MQATASLNRGICAPAPFCSRPIAPLPKSGRHICRSHHRDAQQQPIEQDLQGPVSTLGKRQLISAAAASALLLPLGWGGAANAERYEAAAQEPVVTNKVVLSLGLAPRSFKTAGERTLGDVSVIPLDDAAANPIGTITLGLYGQSAPDTVANFLRLVKAGVLQGTVFSRVLPGEYIQAGGQGAYRLGFVEAAKAGLQPNSDLTSASAFRLRHARPGTLSLSLSECDEDPELRTGNPAYRPTEFLITTGPGPVPRLDGGNLVFGRVLEGMSTVSAIAQVPTFKPSERSKQLNVFAQTIGDDRAATVRRKYGKPLKAVVILKAEEVPIPVSAPAAAVATAAVGA